MSRTLFGSTDFTTENILNDTRSLSELADVVFTSEVLAAHQEADIEADETVVLVTEYTSENLRALSNSLKNHDNISHLTYESYVNSINTVSKLLSANLTVEALDSSGWDEKKQETLGDLETTVEGFLGDITSSIGTVSRKILNGTKNLLTTVFTRQKALGSMAVKLQKRMEGKSPSNIKLATIKVGGASKWFEGGKDAVEKMHTFDGLRKAMPNVQNNLRELPTTLSASELNNDRLFKILSSGLNTLARAPGVKVAHETNDSGDVYSIQIPSTLGRSKLWAIVKFSAKTATSVVGGLGVMTAIGQTTALFATAPYAVPLAAAAAVAFGTYKALTWVAKKHLPVMEWKEIEDVLKTVTSMSQVELSLKGMSGILAKLEGVAKKVAKESPNKKKALKDAVKLLSMYGSIFRGIYSSSVSCARAAVSYATASLKAHLKGGSTEENRIEEDPFYKELISVSKTFGRLDDILTDHE